MSKVKNETIGHVTCPFTGERADVRRTGPKKKTVDGKTEFRSSNLLYYVSSIGAVMVQGAVFQKWMTDNAVLGDDKTAEMLPESAAPDAGPTPVVPGAPEKKSPAPVREKSGILSRVSDFLNEDI